MKYHFYNINQFLSSFLLLSAHHQELEKRLDVHYGISITTSKIFKLLANRVVFKTPITGGKNLAKQKSLVII